MRRILRAAGSVVLGCAAVVAGFGPLDALAQSAGAADDGGLYGTVVTLEGKRLTGGLRWDRNERFWNDVLDARKQLPDAARSESDDVTVKLFGVTLFKRRERWRQEGRLTVPFGDLARLETTWDGGARLITKSGETLEALGGADLGSFRGLLVDDGTREHEIDWDDIVSIAFSPRTAQSSVAEGGAPAPRVGERRLYGTVETDGRHWTGFIAWDRDEVLLDDILDGYEDRRSVEVAFEDIAEVVRSSHRGSIVKLHDGSERFLSGTNDVDDGHRGMDVLVPGLGRVRIPWDETTRVVFRPPPASPAYAAFDGGGPLRARIEMTGGAALEGRLLWDLDEGFSFEELDGDLDEAEISVAFRNVAKIEPLSGGGSRVVLRDGSELTLTGSNDVESSNRGIQIWNDEGRVDEIAWERIEAVVFPE
ncbi:MAG: hypothetical protein OER88_14095 [Planctomycetota bacterium]|nr:hypothetical protein [Planctomycetota bacterium]